MNEIASNTQPTSDDNTQITQRSAWWAALRANDLVSAQASVAAGFDIEDLSGRSETGFLFFAGNGMKEQANWLSQQGADVNAADLSGYNAMHLVVRRGAAAEIAQVAGWGVDINAQDRKHSFASCSHA